MDNQHKEQRELRDRRNEASSHIGLEWGEQFAYEWYHVTESVMRNLERLRKHGKSIMFHGHALHMVSENE